MVKSINCEETHGNINLPTSPANSFHFTVCNVTVNSICVQIGEEDGHANQAGTECILTVDRLVFLGTAFLRSCLHIAYLILVNTQGYLSVRCFILHLLQCEKMLAVKTSFLLMKKLFGNNLSGGNTDYNRTGYRFVQIKQKAKLLLGWPNHGAKLIFLGVKFIE